MPWTDISASSLSSIPFAAACGLCTIEVERILPDNHGTIQLKAILPCDLENLAEILLSKDIMPFLRNYYAYQPSLKEQRFEDIFQKNAEEKIREIVHQSLSHKTNVCFTHIRFQDIRIYLEIMGEHKSLDTVDMIHNLIKNNVKEKDSVFVLSPVSYLIVSPNAESKAISDRFAGFYFQISRIIIDYDLFQAVIEKEPEDYFALWQELKI